MSEFPAATPNPLRAREIVANDTIVVAGLVSASPFGNYVCARAGGAGRFARGPAVAVDLPDATTAGDWSGCASSRFRACGRKAVGRSGTDNPDSAAARGRAAEAGTWRASVRGPSPVRRREARMLVLL